MKEPKDLGIKIGTEKQVLWSKVKKEAEGFIKQSEDNLIIQKELLKLSEEKIAQEKEKLVFPKNKLK
tara:strand:+ start:3602 stop:3802 length:201 start_codon:yes stop_codon:yes gene_type:complete